jgi:hypothetical protein
LLKREEFVGLVRLGDIAGPADHGGIAAGLELAAFGAIADHVPAIVAGQTAHQRFCSAIGFRRQRR